MIEIDGNYEEGGGQIIRTALALSMIYKKAFKAKNIRAGRANPGLKAQHLACIRIFKELSNSQADGDDLKSTELTFYPGNLKKRTVSMDIGTAGALTLLLQSILPVLIHDQNRYKIDLSGGTDTKWSMPIDYFSEIIIPQLSRFSDITLTVEKRGFYPKGGGKIELVIKKKKTKRPLNLINRNEIIAIRGRAFAHSDLESAQVAERMAKSAKVHLTRHNVPINIDIQYVQTKSIGCGIVCYALLADKNGEVDSSNPIRLGADMLGELKIKAEDVGKRCADKLTEEIESQALVDQNQADNLIPYLLLYGGQIKISKLTDHIKANIYVCEQFSEKRFKIEKNIISIQEN